MSSPYYKNAIPQSSLGITHPFKIDIGQDGTRGDGTPNYTLSINYHSRLYIGMKIRDKYLSYEKKNITGLDFPEPVPSQFPGENIYCVLDLTITDLIVQEATIKYIIGDRNQEELDPIVFESTENLRQIGARVIIGVLVNDDEEFAGLPFSEESQTPYIIQFVRTNLMISNMVFDGIPVIYPVPFIGGRLNDEFV